MTTSFPRILLADSIGVIREGMAALVHRVLPDAAITQTETAGEFKAAACSGPWRLIVFNPALPADDGVGLARLARTKNPDTPILIFTLLDEGQFGVAAVEAGATGYLEVTARSLEIMAALRALLEGGRYISPRLERLWQEHGNARAARNGYAALSTRERRVLRAFADGSGVKQAALTLGVSPSTIGTYRVRLLKKLKLRTTVDLIRYVAENRLDGGSASPFASLTADDAETTVRRVG